MRPRTIIAIAAVTGLLAAISPLGTWLAARAVSYAVSGPERELAIGATRGWLLRSQFDQVRFAARDGSLDAIAQEIRLELPRMTAAIVGLDLRVRADGDFSVAPDAGVTTVGEPLPLYLLPALSVTEGQVEISTGNGSGIIASGIDLRYDPIRGTPQDEPSGHLQIGASSIQMGDAQEQFEAVFDGKATVHPGAAHIESLGLQVFLPGRALVFNGAGNLLWQRSFPLRLELAGTAHDSASAVSCSLALNYEGDLNPLEGRLALAGTVTHSSIGDAVVDGGCAVDGSLLVAQATVQAAGGIAELRASYDADTDSLTARVHIVDAIELAPLGLLPHSAGGSVTGTLKATARPNSGLYAADLAARLGDISLPPDTRLDLDVTAVLDDDGELKLELNSSAGTIAGQGTVSVDDGDYDLFLDGAVETKPFLGFVSAPVVVNGRVQPDTIRIGFSTAHLPSRGWTFGPVGLDAVIAGGHLRAVVRLEESGAATATLDLEHSRIDEAVVSISQLALSRFAPELGGSVTGTVTGAGTVDVSGMSAGGELALQELSYGGWTIGTVSAEVALDEGAVHIGAIGDGLRGKVRLDTGSVDLRLQLDHFTLRRKGGADELDHVTVSGVAEGAVTAADDVRASLVLDTVEGSIGGRSLRGESQQVVRYENGSLVIERLRLRGPYGLLDARGSASVDSLALSVTVDSLLLSSFHDSLGGQVSGDLAVSRSSSLPRADARFESDDISFSGRRLGRIGAMATLRDSLDVELSFRQGEGSADTTLTIALAASRADLLLRAAGGSDSTCGTGALAGIDLRAVGVDLTQILSAVVEDSVTGELGLSGSILFPIPNPSRGLDALQGAIEIDHFRIGSGDISGYLPPGARITLDGARALELEGFSMEVEDRVAAKGAPSTLGRLELIGGIETDGSADFQLRVQDVDLAVVDLLTGEWQGVPAGLMNGSASVSGGQDERVFAATTEVLFEDMGELRADLKRGPTSLTASAEWTTEVADIVTATLDVPWDTGEDAASWSRAMARLHTEGLNLFVFLDLLPQLDDVDGFLTADVSLGSLGTGVELTGEVVIEGVQVALPDVKPRFEFASGRIEFERSRGRFVGFTGKPLVGPGQLDVDGFVGLDSADTFDYDITLKVVDLPYVYDDFVAIEDIDADIVFKKDGAGTLVEGQILVDSGLAELPIVDLTAPPVPPRAEEVQSPFLERTRLDLALTLRALEVRNELADIDIDGAARVYGTFYKPRFQGELLIPEGRIIALNREFVFTKGRVVLDKLVPTHSILDLTHDPLLLNPELDLEAVATVKPIDEDEDREVFMSLKGPVLSVAPRFESPGLEDMDVITLLAFGSTSTAHSDRAFLYEAAAAAAGQLLLSRQVQRLGVDEFQIMPSGTVLGTVGEPSLRLGKFLSAPLPVWVRYEALRREPSFGELQFEYKMKSYLTINGTAHSELELYGLGVGLKKDF